MSAPDAAEIERVAKAMLVRAFFGCYPTHAGWEELEAFQIDTRHGWEDLAEAARAAVLAEPRIAAALALAEAYAADREEARAPLTGRIIDDRVRLMAAVERLRVALADYDAATKEGG